MPTTNGEVLVSISRILKHKSYGLLSDTIAITGTPVYRYLREMKSQLVAEIYSDRLDNANLLINSIRLRGRND